MKPNTINTSISITKRNQSRLSTVDFENLKFGHTKSDHMFVANYSNGKWNNLEIKPYDYLQLSPACIGLHYGQSIFEGMKAFKTNDGKISIFRPEMNMQRMQRSAIRMGMAPVADEVFMEGLKTLLDIDRAWVPDGDEKSLYIRPFQFGDEPNIGVHESETYQFIIFTCPTGAYYSKDVKVFVEEEYIRAARGGAGSAKAAGNYGPTLLPTANIKDKGFDQILWTQVIDNKRYVQEIGTMNFFVQIDDVLITPELDGTILEGITRNSLLTLAKDEGIKVEERLLSVDELFTAAKEGRVQDCFGAGTAAVITHIQGLGRREEYIELPSIDSRKTSHLLKQKLSDIRRGIIEDKYNWMTTI